MFVDYYEVLQISPNADVETVRRVYRMQAQRFHPDNLDSGNGEAFRKISTAYEVLNDPQRREKILSLLYSRRFSHPQQPSLNLRELEALLKTPRGDLEFSLWYLKECGYLVRTDSAH